MRQTKFFCDRCHTEVLKNLKILVQQDNLGKTILRWELCEDCINQFRDGFMRR